MHDKIFDILFNKDEITWQSIIFELVRTEEMNPWDVDVSTLSHKYIEMIKKMQKMDLRISGKVLLAAALLLRIKSDRLMGADLEAFDKMMAGEEDSFLDEEGSLAEDAKRFYEKRQLIPKTPQPRKRKVSIYDLVSALEKALEVRNRRVLNNVEIPSMSMPERKFDITKVIDELYAQISNIFNQKNRTTFSELVPSDSKQDKVYTFVPLLHLENSRKIDMEQESHFGEIGIVPPKPDDS